MEIDPKLLVIKPINEIQTASDPLSGQVLIYDGGNELKKASLQGIKDSVSSGIKGEATPSTVPTPWISGQPDLYEKYDVKVAGTFTNFKDSNNASIVVTAQDLKDNFVQLWVNNGVATKMVSAKIQGDSAYEVAVRNGFVGTEPEWVESLKPSTHTDSGYTGGFINSLTGSFNASVGYSSTGYLPIDFNKDLTVSGWDGGADNGVTGVISLVAFYNQMGEHISTYTTGTSGQKTNVIIPKASFPVNAVYVRATKKDGGVFGIKGLANNSNNTSLSFKKILSPEFNISGYINKNTGVIGVGATYRTTDFLPIRPTDSIVVQGYNLTSGTNVVSMVNFYDKSQGYIGFLNGLADGTQTVTLNSSNIPANASFIKVVCRDSNIGYVDGISINSIISSINATTSEVMTTYREYSNNGFSQRGKDNSTIKLLTPISTYGKFGAQYEIVNSNTNGVCHLAFEFKIGEDVNKSIADKTIVRFEKGTDYIEFYIKTAPTTEFIGKDFKVESASSINSSIPLPYYNSQFGVKSNLVTGGDRLNKLLDKRTLEFDRNSVKMCYKPLSGDDLFQLRIVAVDALGVELNTRTTEAQTILANWDTAYVEITDIGVIVVCPKLSLSWSFDYTTYTTMSSLYQAIRTTLNEKVFNGAKFLVNDINSGGYSSEGTKFDVTKLVRAKIKIATTYPKGIEYLNNSFIDSFPLYFTYAIDDSWHSFEMASMVNLDRMVWTIDGQYNSIHNDYLVDNVREFLKGSTIKLGIGLSIKVKNISLETNGYKNCELKEFPGYSHIMVSKLHPLIMNWYQHDIYFKGDDGEGLTNQRKFVSNGGTIPESLKNPDPLYVGDDCIQADRQNLVYPSYVFEKGLALFKARGYKYIKDTELADRMKSGVFDHNRYYTVGFDDYPTYIYEDKRLRDIFVRNGAYPYFALELGMYVDVDAPTTLYNAADFIAECHDTSEHRKKLLRRVDSMQRNGWQVQMHGYKRGNVFQTLTFQEVKGVLDESMRIAEYYGIQSNTWCFAGNYYTPNAIKFMERYGIAMSTSIAGRFHARCHHLNYVPRTAFLYIDADVERAII